MKPVRSHPSYHQRVAEILRASADTIRRLEPRARLLAEIAAAIERCYRSGGKVILFGNGGSAADAQHIAAEFQGRFYLKRPSLAAIALNTNSSALTAIANDLSFADVFALPLSGLARPGDVAFGLSTSGMSANVISALKTARQMKLVTVGFTGAQGRRLVRYCDYCLAVPSNDTPRIQEAHICAGHIICELVEHSLFGKCQD